MGRPPPCGGVPFGFPAAPLIPICPRTEDGWDGKLAGGASTGQGRKLFQGSECPTDPGVTMPKPTPLPRLLPVPADPPYDDLRVPADPPPTHGALALACAPVTYEPMPRGSLEPDERRLRGLGQAVAEILAGRRPPDTVQDRLTEG